MVHFLGSIQLHVRPERCAHVCVILIPAIGHDRIVTIFSSLQLLTHFTVLKYGAIMCRSGPPSNHIIDVQIRIDDQLNIHGEVTAAVSKIFALFRKYTIILDLVFIIFYIYFCSQFRHRVRQSSHACNLSRQCNA